MFADLPMDLNGLRRGLLKDKDSDVESENSSL